MPQDRLDLTDFYEMKLYSAMHEGEQSKLQILQLQLQNGQLLSELARERAKTQVPQAEAVEKKLTELQQRLHQKYGIENADEVDWETGEIKKTSSQQAPQSGAVPTTRTAATPAGAQAPSTSDERGTADLRPTVERVPQG